MDTEDDLPAVVKQPGDVRRLQFSNAQINESLDRQLAALPTDAKVAFVATAFKEGGQVVTKLAVFVNKSSVFRAGDQLSFGGFLEGSVKRPLDRVGAEVRYVIS